MMNRRGQIILPSVLIIPSLLLFVYLLFEITKLSREKIRHQFAVDSAAFIEMTNYSDFFNRTAYVNGSFPHRIFKEAYDCPPNEHLQMTSGGGSICPYDMLYEAGCFPRYEGDDSEGMMDIMSKWPIRFSSARSGMNANPPVFDSTLKFITEDQGIKIYIFWDPAIGLYKFFAQVYNLLGSVEMSQKTVFERLTENFNFFRKSYYLNTGECRQFPEVCGEDGLAQFEANRVHPVLHFISQLKFWAKVPKSGLPPYYLGVTNPPLDMTQGGAPGLFQLATVPDDELAPLKQGFSVYQGWDAPSNYFGIDVNKLAPCPPGNIPGARPCVHARIASQCPDENNNCVWPDPTPKYQTRLYP